MITPAKLRQRSEIEAADFPPLLAQAEHLAGTILLGEHGRRRSGFGDDFWQYRPAQIGDGARNIDWRRSARSDSEFVREREWKVAQSVMFWIDTSASMSFTSSKNITSKGERAQVLALATAILLVRGGERIGLAGQNLPPQSGDTQILRMADMLCQPNGADYGTPSTHGMPRHARAIFMSDFMGDMDAIRSSVVAAAEQGIQGVLLHILDPSEEAFPFSGRTIFESMGKTVRHETLKAADLQNRYLDRLQERKSALADLCIRTNWQYHCHHTNTPAQAELLWLYRALDHASFANGARK